MYVTESGKTACVFVSSRSLVSFDCSAPHNVVRTQLTNMHSTHVHVHVYGDSARVRSNVFQTQFLQCNTMSTHAQKASYKCISETVLAIPVKLGRTMVA